MNQVMTTRRDSKTLMVLAGVGLLLIGLNLRISIASVGPVLSEIRDDLHLNATVVSLLTSIPVITFGALAFLTPALSRRFGLYRLLAIVMTVLVIGTAVRLHASLGALFLGTLLIGASIAVGNVVVPALIKKDFPGRTGLMTGAYSAMLFLGAALASGLTAPLVPHLGGSWRAALAFWTIPAVLALIIWLPRVLQRGEADATPIRTLEASFFRRILTDRIALAVTALMSIQSMSYYAVLTWVPTLLRDNGMDAATAGWMVAFSALPAAISSMIFPLIARRMRPVWLAMLFTVLLYGAGYLGLAIAPLDAPYLWMTLIGLGQGGSISLSLSYIVWRSPDALHAGYVSTMSQGFGYLVAGLGPTGIGALYAFSGGWTIPLIGLGLLLVAQMAVGAIASREVFIGARREARV